MDNQHKKISGYRDLTQAEIDLMNEVKAFEAKAVDLYDRILAAIEYAPGCIIGQRLRDMSFARTHFEDATIRMVRAIAYPVSPWFPHRTTEQDTAQQEAAR